MNNLNAIILHPDQESRCTLQDVLIFFTGASAIPVLGFEVRPKLVFLEGPSERLPTASTCELHLRIPTAHGDNFGALLYAWTHL